ncbi:MAG: NPXTG-anchored protein [Oscillospiraceae bacterium]|nr:NPXTG-anchored protein [Oscillospiraceae bacterium]
MKLRRILAATAAAAITTAAMSVAASAQFVTAYGDDDQLQFACLQSNDWHESMLADSADLANVTGFTVTLKLDDAQLEDYLWVKAEMTDAWFGGVIGVNSPSTGWKDLATWGHEGGSEDILWESTGTDGVYTCTYKADAPIFAADDDYAFFFFQDYSTFKEYNWNVTDVTLYGAGDSVIETVNVGNAAEGGSAEDGDSAGSTEGNTDENKNSADTGVEGIALAAGAAALAGAAVIASRKRK